MELEDPAQIDDIDPRHDLSLLGDAVAGQSSFAMNKTVSISHQNPAPNRSETRYLYKIQNRMS
jgi:hypothetical protein